MEMDGEDMMPDANMAPEIRGWRRDWTVEGVSELIAVTISELL